MKMNILDQVITDEHSIYNADCIEVAKGLPDDSIDFSVYSPPFSSLYTYSNSDRDMVNAKSDEEFYEHFRFLVKEQFRVIKLGRLVSLYCMNLLTSKVSYGFIGIKVFKE